MEVSQEKGGVWTVFTSPALAPLSTSPSTAFRGAIRRRPAFRLFSCRIRRSKSQLPTLPTTQVKDWERLFDFCGWLWLLSLDKYCFDTPKTWPQKVCRAKVEFRPKSSSVTQTQTRKITLKTKYTTYSFKQNDHLLLNYCKCKQRNERMSEVTALESKPKCEFIIF